MNFVTFFVCFYNAYHGEKTKKKKLSGGTERKYKKLQSVNNNQTSIHQRPPSLSFRCFTPGTICCIFYLAPHVLNCLDSHNLM